MRKLSALLAAFLMLCLPITALAAESPYDQRVYDGAELFSSDELEQVQTAADELSELIGADVRVMAFNTIGDAGNLDMFIGQITKDTPSWQSPNGGMNSSLLVFAIAMESHDMGIYFADPGLWSKALANGGEKEIYDEFTYPHFAGGDFATGFISAMQETGKVIDEYLHPPVVAPLTQPVRESNPAITAALLSLLGLAALTILILLGIKFARKLKSEREAKEVARQNALRLRDAVSSTLSDFRDPTHLTVQKAKVAKYSKLDPSRAAKLKALLSDFESNYEAATSKMSSAASASAMPEDQHLAIGVYQAMAERYDEALNDARAAVATISNIDKIANEIQKNLDSISDITADLEQQFTRITDKITALKPLPINTDAEQTALASEKTRFESLKATDDNTMATFNELKSCTDNLETISNSLDELDKIYHSVKRNRPVIPDKISNAEQLVRNTEPIFSALAAKFAETSWESVAGNGSRATELIAEAKAHLAKSDEFAAVSDVRNADAEISTACHHIATATDLLEAIIYRKHYLDQAYDRAPEEFRLAQIDIDKAKQYVSEHFNDLDAAKHRASITDAENDLAIAKAEFAKELPDPDIVISKALEANHDADRILELCMNEHEQAERQRRQAADALKKLQSDLDQTERYIRNHSSDTDSTDRRALEDAKIAYQNARHANDAATIIMLASTAMRQVDSAYSRAQRNVRSAEEERERARRRQQEAARRQHQSSVSGSHRSFSSPSSIGGSSRSFGSSSSIGGSSRKW